ncbi:transcriptional regulator TrmB [Sulfolobus islandicus L.S.2.15]|uniref:Transcriptional regulator TrmB n=1 Tax=Saccharolobus islandicus (strain L.S.2.15 / Lassen \|nr:helix-turn-helix domain-containing protein [Sulfolobus islandicus]ACP35454.1 transcriptional regulator TrmB [Sulfolobus islandicus L.S.2.15]
MIVIRRSKKHTEKIATESEKLNVNKQSKTEKPGISGESGDFSPESPESPEPLVDNQLLSNNKSQNYEIIIKDEKKGNKVYAHIEKVKETATVVYDKVLLKPVLKITLKYRNEIRECTTGVLEYNGSYGIIGCHDAIRAIAKRSSYHPTVDDIYNAINEYVKTHFPIEETSLVDYVRQKYADRLAEIEKDPFGWILTHTREIVGYDRLKLLTLLSVISSRMKRVVGISRIHLNIVGQSGAGKSSVVKSVLKYLDDNMKFDATRFTEKSLGYLDIDTFDGKVVFLEQIDNQNVAYLREAMSEEKICTYVTEKVATEDGGEKHVTKKVCIDGQPVFITTSVSDRVDLEREQIANRMLNVYLKYEYNRDVIETIIERAENEVSDVDKMTFMAYLLTRPETADVTPIKDEIIAFIDKLAELTRSPVNRTVEILRNLVRAVAIARGKTKADVDDFNFVMQNFQLDVLFNGLGLTERDVEIIEALPDEGGLKSQEVADALKISKQYAINVLKNLERKGVVEGVKEDNKTFTWYLTMLGRKIKALINNLDKDIIEVRDEKGELVGVADAKFRSNTDAENDRSNGMSGDERDAMQRGNGETNRVVEAYDYLKKHGWTLTTDIAGWFGDDVIEKLKRKDLVTFNVIDGVEYVSAK